jgi:hypothetical protein
MTKRKKAIIAVIVLLLISFLGWKLWARSGNDANEVARLQKAMEDLKTPEDWQKFNNGLTPDQREKLREAWGERREKREQKEVDGYYETPPEKRQEYIDRKIAEEEKRRKEWADRRAQRGQGTGGQGGGRPGGQGPGGPGGPGGGPPGGQAGPGGGGNGPGGAQRGGSPVRSPEANSQRLNKRLDRTSATQRAQATAYRQAMAARRAQLGLPPMGPPGGGRGGR